jgi:hypothetical protein
MYFLLFLVTFKYLVPKYIFKKYISMYVSHLQHFKTQLKSGWKVF